MEHILTTTYFDIIKCKVIIHKNQVISDSIYRDFRIFFALEHQDKNFNAILEGPLNTLHHQVLPWKDTYYCSFPYRLRAPGVKPYYYYYYYSTTMEGGATMMLMGSDSDTSELTMSPIRTCRKQ